MTRLPTVPLNSRSIIVRLTPRQKPVLAPTSAAGGASKVLSSAHAPAQLILPLWGPARAS